MGSLASTPKVPKTQIVQTPVATPTPSAPAPVKQEQANDPTLAQNAASEERARGLLARGRSRFGTIATSFQGFLQETNQGARKTLLGE